MYVCIYKIAHNRVMRPCHHSHYMPLALVLPKEDQKYLLRKPLIRGNKEDKHLSTCTLSALRFPCVRVREREGESVFINLHIVCVFIKLHMPHIPAMSFKLFYATHSGGPPKGGSMIFTMKASDETR